MANTTNTAYDAGATTYSSTGINSPAALGTNTNGTSATAGMDVAKDLTLRAISKKLQMESVLDDIFEDLGAEVVGTGDSVAVPDAIFLKLEAAPSGARQVTIPFLMALTGAPTIGPGTPIGNEQKQQLKYATFKYEEFSYAVASENWGTVYNDMSVYGVFEQIQPQISKYMKELRGQRIREALLFTYDSILTGGTAPVETATWNKNWFVPNTALDSQPRWNPTTGTFTASIIAALDAAGGATDGASARVSLDYLRALDYYATNYLRIDPLMVDGKKTYVLVLPSTQKYVLATNTPGQLGDIYTGMVRSAEDEMKYTGMIGRVGSILVVEDQRYPELEFTAADALGGLFVKPGDSDERKKSPYDGAAFGTKHWDVGYLMGKAAVTEWIVQDLHFETEEQNYGRDRGTGAFCESGISLVQYDIDTPTAGATAGDDTKENFGSIVCPLATPPIVA